MSTPPNRREHGKRKPTRRTTAVLAAAVALILGAAVAGGAWWVQRDDAETSVSPGTYVPPSEIAGPTSSSDSSSTSSPSSQDESTSTSSSSTSSSSDDESSEESEPEQATTRAETSPSDDSESKDSTNEDSESESSTSEDSEDEDSGSADTGESVTNPQGNPTRVVVRSGGKEIVDASLQATYLDSENVLAPPFGTAGWYAEPGWPKPGFQGASILVGHINHGGEPDVFWNLPQVNIGDIVTVDYSSGEQTQFRITRSEPASKEGVPDDESIWDHDNPEPVVRLITCDPETSFEDGHYSGNWVVWAEQV